MQFLRECQEKLFALLNDTSVWLRGRWFWRGRAFSVALWLLPLLLFAARLVLSLYEIPFTPGVYWSIYVILFIVLYAYLFPKEEAFFLTLFKSRIVSVILRWGCVVEELLFKVWWGWIPLSLSLVGCLVLLQAGVLSAMMGLFLRRLLAFYIYLRTMVLYEGNESNSPYIAEVPLFRRGFLVFNSTSLDENKNLSLLVATALFLSVQVVGTTEGSLEGATPPRDQIERWQSHPNRDAASAAPPSPEQGEGVADAPIDLPPAEGGEGAAVLSHDAQGGEATLQRRQHPSLFKRGSLRICKALGLKPSVESRG